MVWAPSWWGSSADLAWCSVLHPPYLKPRIRCPPPAPHPPLLRPSTLLEGDSTLSLGYFAAKPKKHRGNFPHSTSRCQENGHPHTAVFMSLRIWHLLTLLLRIYHSSHASPKHVNGWFSRVRGAGAGQCQYSVRAHPHFTATLPH